MNSVEKFRLILRQPVLFDPWPDSTHHPADRLIWNLINDSWVLATELYGVLCDIYAMKS